MCVPFTLPIKSLPSVRFFCFVLFFKIKRKKKNRHGHIKLILKGYFTQKWKFWHHLHLLSSFKSVWVSLFCRTQGKIFWRKFVTRLFWGTIDFHSRKKNTIEVNGAPELLCFPHSSEYLPLCSAEQRNSYRFETTWGWVNDDRIFIFGWIIPLITRLPRILK